MGPSDIGPHNICSFGSFGHITNIHWNIISAIREVFQGNGGFATLVRPDTLQTLVECSLYSMLDHLAMIATLDTRIALQPNYCFVL